MWIPIVGAGPSGLLLALMLGQQGVEVDVVETSPELDKEPRATHFPPPARVRIRQGWVDRGNVQRRPGYKIGMLA